MGHPWGWSFTRTLGKRRVLSEKGERLRNPVRLFQTSRVTGRVSKETVSVGLGAPSPPSYRIEMVREPRSWEKEPSCAAD